MPRLFVLFGLAPATNNNRVRSALSLSAASCSGVFSIRIRARGQQHHNNVNLPGLRGPEEQGITVNVSAVRVVAVGQQLPHRPHATSLRRDMDQGTVQGDFVVRIGARVEQQVREHRPDVDQRDRAQRGPALPLPGLGARIGTEAEPRPHFRPGLGCVNRSKGFHCGGEPAKQPPPA